MTEGELYDEAAVILSKELFSKQDIKDLDRIIGSMFAISKDSMAGRGLAETVELIRMDPSQQAGY